jgi:hypothetical protein
MCLFDSIIIISFFPFLFHDLLPNDFHDLSVVTFIRFSTKIKQKKELILHLFLLYFL